jgi:hypothetical protein
MTVSISDLATLLTALVAVAGLILSIYNFYIDRRDKTPRLAAKISNGFLTYGPKLSDVMLFLEVANTGEKKAIVSAVEIKWKKQKIVFMGGIKGTVNVPFELQPGDSARFWTPVTEVKATLKDEGCAGREYIRACFRTAVDSEYVSKKFPVDV